MVIAYTEVLTRINTMTSLNEKQKKSYKKTLPTVRVPHPSPSEPACNTSVIGKRYIV